MKGHRHEWMASMAAYPLHPIPPMKAIPIILLAFGLVASRLPAENNNDLDIVLVLADDLGWADLGCQGSTFYETPNLDRFASTGARFTNAYSACQVCSPSRAAFLTGRYPQRGGVTDYIGAAQPGGWNRNTRFLPAQYSEKLPVTEKTLAELLAPHGYTSVFAGKWHLGPEGNWPENRGFAENHGGWDKGGPYGPKGYFSPYGNPRLKDGPPGEHISDRLAKEIATFLNRPATGPRLAVMCDYNVHTPLMAPEDLVAKYEAKRKRLGLIAQWGEEAPRQVRLVQEHAVYAAMVETMDRAFGAVLEAVEKSPRRDQTIIIFTSDNGGLSTSEGSPTSNLPLRGGKGWIYEGGIRVPMLVRWPGVTKPGSTIDVPVGGIDVAPTIMRAAGQSTVGMDGIDLRPVLAGEAVPERALFWHYPHYGNQGGGPSSAMRLGPWKLIHDFDTNTRQLYHLEKDPAEANDLSAKEPDRVKAMTTALDAWKSSVGAKDPTANAKFKPDGPNGRGGKRK
jgi:arylsulfatase A-like enzyme